MAVFKATQNKSNSAGKFKATKNRSYDSALVSSWETSSRDAYKELEKYHRRISSGEYLSSDDLAAYQKALDSYEDAEKNIRRVSMVLGQSGANNNAAWADSVSNMKKNFKGISDYYSQWKTEDDYKSTLARWDDYNKKWGHYPDEEDFDEYAAKGAAIENPKLEDAERGRFLWWEWGGTDVGNIVTYSRENADMLAMAHANGKDTQGNYVYRSMTDDEVNIYNYLLGKGLKDEAASFLSELQEELNAREGRRMAERITSIDIPVLEDLAVLSYGFGAGVDQFGSGVRQFFTGEELPTSVTQYANAYIGESLDGFGAYAHQAATTIGNMAPSILLSYVTGAPAVGNVSMGISAAGNAYSDALSKGYDKASARFYSTLVGAAEGYLQHAIGGITKLGGMSSKLAGKIATIDNSLLRISAKLGTSALSEITEEELQNFLEPAFRTLIFGEDYDAPTFDELIETAIVTALSTGTLEGGGTVATNSYAKSKYGTSQKELVNEALEIDQNNTFAQKMKGRLDSGRNLSGSQLSHLVDQNEATLTAQDMATIKSTAENMLTKYGETGDVSAIAAALAKQAAGEKLSRSEQHIISNSKYGERVANEMNPDNIKSGGYNSAWAEKLDTNRINVEEYSRLVESAQLPQEGAETVGAVDSLKDASKKYGAQANAMIHTYQAGQDVEKFDKAYQMVYDMGKGGVALSYAMESDAASYLTESQRELAYEAGTAVSKADAERSSKVSVDGQMVNTKTGDTIEPQGLVQAEDGTYMIATKDADPVSNSDVSYADNNQALVYETFINLEGNYGKTNKVIGIMDLESRNALIGLYNPAVNKDGGSFAKGAVSAFFHGHQGIDLSAISKTSPVWELTEQQRKTAWNQGRIAGVKATNAAQSAVDTTYAEAQKVLKQTGKAKSGSYHAVLEDGITPMSLNESQKAVYRIADDIAQGIKTNIRVYAGKNKAQGFYNPQTDEIWLNLNAANRGGEAIMAFTLAHELVHRARKGSPAKYKAFTEFLMKEYGKQGSDVDAMIAEQMTAAEEFNKTVPQAKRVNMTREKAIEEVAADACQRMLLDTNAGQKLAEFGAQSKQNKSFLDDLKRWIGEILDKLRSYFKNVDPDSMAAKEFAKFDKNVKQMLADMYVDMSIDAGEKLSTIHAAGDAFAEKILATRDIQYNLAAVETHKDKLQKEYSEDSSTDLKTIMARYDKIIDVWTRLGGELNSKFLADWNSKIGKDRTFTIFKAQAGYKYNVELSSMCKKGVPLFEAIDTIVKQEVMKELGTEVLGKAEKEILYDILKQHNFEIPCAICYVEQARQREGVIIDAFLNGKVDTNAKGETTKVKLGWNQVLDSIQKEMKANGVDYSFAQVSRDIATEKYSPANLDMDSKTQDAFYAALKKIANQEITRYNKAEGKSRKLLNEVTPAAVKECFKGTLPSNLKIFKVLFEEPSSRFKIQNDLLYSSVATQNLSMAHNKLYGLFNSQGGVSGYKTKQGTTIYWGDILGKSWKPDTLRNEGGVRNQSNSDFQMYTLLDQAQMYIDFTAKGYYLQAYTKVLSELKLFGLSRGKINASLIPKVVVYRNSDGSVDVEKTMDTAGLDENGNPIYDDIEGINHDEAFMLIEDPEYSKSICGICIGYSDAHILKLLDDNRVQQIIGFHDKTDDGTKRYKGARYAKNYNGLNEAVNKEGKTIHIGFNSYVKKAEKKFQFNTETETFEGTVNYNGKTYTADDIPRLAADLYLEMCAKKEYTPAYEAFSGHRNYYKLLADFCLYDSQGHYAPHRKVVYNMPDTVPYLDANGKKQTMKTYDYIKVELEKELAVRDSIAEALADTSSEGIIPRFKAAVKKRQAELVYSLPKGDPAPTFYSHMARVVDGVKQDKLGASSVVSMLRGKGVKAEEIKWSGIEEWLDGKKSVTNSMADSVMTDGQPLYSLPKMGDKKSPTTLTEQDLRDLLQKAKDEELDDGTYFPIRTNTPDALLDAIMTVSKKLGITDKEELEKLTADRPIAIQVFKARQSLATEEDWHENGRPHNLTIDDVVAIVKKMDDPQYIVYEGSTGRYVEILKYHTKNGSEAFAVVELENFKDEPYLNGYAPEMYNVLVTLYQPDAKIRVTKLLNGKDNIVIHQQKKKGNSQVTSGIHVPSVLNKSPFAPSITQEEDVVNAVSYKLPIGEDTSPRALLANAFEGIITNDIEKRKIQEYKGKVEMLNAEEQKLHELRAQIKELSFSNGKRDTKKIKDLRFEAMHTANRIATLDSVLLRLEASAPLQSILKREKEMAYKRAEQKGKEALEAYKKAERERDQKWQREVKEKYQASKKKAIETREKREAREKLQKLVIDTAKWISYPAKTDVKCPDILKQPYADFLKGIDMSSKRLADGGDPTKTDLRLANAMGSLATALDKIMTSQDPSQETDKVLDTGYLDLPANFVQKLRDMTENIKAMMVDGDYVVNNMSAAEVRQLSQMIRTLNHAIKEVSALYANLRFANVEALGDSTMSFMDALGEIEKTGGIKDFVEWDNALPYYAFKRFGAGGESIFEGLMDAQDKLAFLAQEIFNFRDKAWTDKEAKAWSEDTHTIDLPNGNTLTLTTADAMSIYCLSRREQGLQHLLGGGTRVMGIQKGSQKTKDSRSVLTIEDIDAINSSLTDRQKQVAEAIQEFMSSVCSEWGNEISMKRFLTKEFTEKFYFPIESNDENLPTKDPAAQQSDLFRLLNISATKPLTPGANNEVIIRNIFDVFTGHASDMARLNAYGMALLDYMKWLNYREKSVNEEGQIKVRGVRKSMEQAYGNAAKSYVLNLVKDVNGRASDGGDPTILMKMMRNAKIASVGANLRVAALQFTSYPRAALVLSTKSIALGLTKAPQITKAKKYCGIALWKSFGFYDTNIARSIEDQMKGVTNIRQKVIELSMKGAEWGDAITWGCLWNACEYEVARTTKNKVGSEEFYQEVGKKLREVVYATQVVDSTLTRSQLMRSKSGMTQEAASFMSEPTLTANILMDAGFQFEAEKRRTGSIKAAWNKTGKTIGRAVAVYSCVALLGALVESLGDAWRDDDDEEFYKKFFEALPENLLLNMLPLNKVPIVSDAVELVLSLMDIGFFSSEKMSTQWLTQIASAVDAWGDVFSGKSTATVYGALYKTVKALSSATGIPGSGALREVVAVWNNTAGSFNSAWKLRTYGQTLEDLRNGLYNAIVSGNERQAESIRKEFRDRSENENEYQSSITSAIRKALRDNDPRIKEAAQAVVDGNAAQRANIAREIAAEGNFSLQDIQAAINAEIDELRRHAKS